MGGNRPLEHERKMDCVHASELLSPFIDDMPDEAQARALRAHLDDCTACRREYEQLARMREILLSVPERPLPAAFDERLRQALARLADEAPADAARPSRAARTRSRHSRRLWSSVAAVLAIGLLSLLVYSRFDTARFGPAGVAGDAALIAENGSEQREGAAAEQSAGADTPAYVVADSKAVSEPVAGAESVRDDSYAEIAAESAAPARTSGVAADADIYGRYESSGYPARGTTTGAHRLDEKAVCDELLRAKLSGWTYEILWEEQRDGVFVYRVNLISNEAGTSFNQEIEVRVSGRAVQILYATEFMGF
jgi:anti-sigma factor RsiW